MALTSLSGYYGQVWRTLLSVLTYTQNSLSSTTAASSQQVVVNAMATTFRNARDAFDAYAYAQAWAQEYDLLAPILTYSLGLDADTLAYVTNRVTAYQQAAVAAASLYPTTFSATSLLPTGVPCVPYPALVEFLMEWSYETAPTDITSVTAAEYPAAFAAAATAQATAWSTVVVALQTQGVTAGQTVDAAQRQAAVALEAATAANNITVASNTNPSQIWNLLISMPSLTRVGGSYLADPTTSLTQQTNIARLVCCQSLDVLNNLLIKLRQALPQQLRVATLTMTDTLVTLAARELGNFEMWPTIAALNNLSPPYILPAGSAPQAGLAVPGQSLFIPVTTTGTSAASTQAITTQVPTYENNYLGVDIYLGPISSPNMLPWTGDFTLISGYSNLANALSRRILTTLGSLMFHPTYGSRVPPEVGAIATSQIAGYLAAYVESAIMTDPRVSQVTGVTASVSDSNSAIQVTATAIPNGTSNSSASINEVLQPN